MKPVSEIIERFEAAGVRLELNGEKVRFVPPAIGEVPPELIPGLLELKEEVRARKPEVIRELERRETQAAIREAVETTASPEPHPARIMAWADVLATYRQRGWVRIESSYLNEPIYLCKDRAAMKRVPDKSVVCYLPDELPALRDLSLEQLRLLHQTKKEFGGIVKMGEALPERA